jgi:hypothetical protein
LEQLQVEDEGEEYVHFDLILSEYYFFKFVEGEFVHAEADEVGEECEEGAIVFAVGGGGEASEDGVVGDFEESAVAFASIEHLFHEYPFGVLAF